ncbi:GcrA family cell cycle regulator [Bradyrhizobium valentinum]|uniref:GcrA cell cycle regulator n=1 Tax=Bradyrhizobium valentinum TaxID=1518501 RepID=A0A0R3KUR5_9BRAD|nr:GcrA family cell cycle regulator [Bradyrhizobium valentinum]KRQ99249.1 hypothetical protein CP49_11670 [Bradyrhizobium valentinum]
MTDAIWSDPAKLKQLIELFDSGVTVQSIADTLDVSRNAVCGKIARLGLKREKKSPEAKPTPALTPAAPPQPAPIVVAAGASPTFTPRPISASPVGKPVSIIRVRKNQCRAPLDERGGDGLTMFCGAPKLAGSSYCEMHHGIFHTHRQH